MDDNVDNKQGLTYGIESTPPNRIIIFLSIQNFLTSFGSLIGIPLMMNSYLCMSNSVTGKLLISKMLCVNFFVGGICTLQQVFLGVRLPIVQGGNLAFMSALIALLSIPENECPREEHLISERNATNLMYSFKGVNQSEEFFVNRNFQYIQGTVIIGGIIQTVIGLTGFIGILLKYISKLTLTLVITLLGMSLFKVGAHTAGSFWPVSIFTILTVIICSTVLDEFTVKLPLEKGKQKTPVAIFKLFPVLIAIVSSWALCIILTVTGILSEDEKDYSFNARVSMDVSQVESADWFKIPRPFGWGGSENIHFSTVGAVGILCGVMASILESIGDYYACSNCCGVGKPPKCVINRGIMMEGIGTIFGGIFGTGNGMTSYSENIGAILVTKVASRRVVIIQSMLMILLGCLVKFSAVITTIPGPVVGGIYCTMFGMITGVGLSNLQHVDLSNSRNTMILGISLYLGIAIPEWAENDHNKKLIQTLTSIEALNNVVFVLMSTGMFIGGLIGCFLDNLLPVRFKNKFGNEDDSFDEAEVANECFRFPFRVPSFLQVLPIFGKLEKEDDTKVALPEYSLGKELD